jgi:N-formylglutamate deformylase
MRSPPSSFPGSTISMTDSLPPWLELTRGDQPFLLSLPHTGTLIPRELSSKFISPSLPLQDVDCWLERLYDFASTLGITVIRTNICRSVIDVNRDPSGDSLYPGRATTGLCPLTTFSGDPLYREACSPTSAEIEERKRDYFLPYHAALQNELTRLRERHESVILYDAHSIRSQIPRLFDGILPHCNLGTYGGKSCDFRITTAIEGWLKTAAFSWVTNGRFQGGWITRRYGAPQRGIHAVQMELARRSYMDETEEIPYGPYSETRSAEMRQFLRSLFPALLELAPQLSTSRP